MREDSTYTEKLCVVRTKISVRLCRVFFSLYWLKWFLPKYYWGNSFWIHRLLCLILAKTSKGRCYCPYIASKWHTAGCSLCTGEQGATQGRKLSCLPSYLVVRRLTYMQGQTGGRQLLLGNIRRNEWVYTESARECPHIAAATAVVLLLRLHQPLPDSTRAATWMYHLCVGVVEVVSWETWFSHPVDKEAEAGTVFFVFRQGTSMCCARASVGYFQGGWSQLTVTVNWSPVTVRVWWLWLHSENWTWNSACVSVSNLVPFSEKFYYFLMLQPVSTVLYLYEK